MKYLILFVFICIVLVGTYSFLNPKPSPQNEYSNSIIMPTTKVMSHTDSIDQFIKWYDNMCDTFCSLTELTDFQIVGPQKNAELNERFSSWHIKLSISDKKSIEENFKRNLKRLITHSSNLLNRSNLTEYNLTEEQIDLMIKITEIGFDKVMDTTSYLDYYVKWTVENYNPPTSNAK